MWGKVMITRVREQSDKLGSSRDVRSNVFVLKGCAAAIWFSDAVACDVVKLGRAASSSSPSSIEATPISTLHTTELMLGTSGDEIHLLHACKHRRHQASVVEMQEAHVAARVSIVMVLGPVEGSPTLASWSPALRSVLHQQSSQWELLVAYPWDTAEGRVAINELFQWAALEASELWKEVVRLVPCRGSVGQAGMLSSAAQVSHGEWLLFLEPGWALAGDFLGIALAAADRTAGVGAVMPAHRQGLEEYAAASPAWGKISHQSECPVPPLGADQDIELASCSEQIEPQMGTDSGAREARAAAAALGVEEHVDFFMPGGIVSSRWWRSSLLGQMIEELERGMPLKLLYWNMRLKLLMTLHGQRASAAILRAGSIHWMGNDNGDWTLDGKEQIFMKGLELMRNATSYEDEYASRLIGFVQ
ncbi:hypothetical protein CYMTET_10892 [Cymbomonas tetramitiformis]|uniref:Uncharacterized protein n=1 Tax=Cymbomonas tetramitiformis TaxID=36881 RepID=A0AAE0LDD4_9CHLO|nr:hypothetical protein CYMTET_10892 [Cymbomonas tetramitiformis]